MHSLCVSCSIFKARAAATAWLFLTPSVADYTATHPSHLILSAPKLQLCPIVLFIAVQALTELP